jgi:hypothetical protein
VLLASCWFFHTAFLGRARLGMLQRALLSVSELPANSSLQRNVNRVFARAVPLNSMHL